MLRGFCRSAESVAGVPEHSHVHLPRDSERHRSTPMKKTRGNPTTQGSTRRTWIKTAAALAGGAATASWPATAASPPAQANGPASGPGVVAASGSKNIVETTAGKVRGFTRNGIY